MGLLFDDASSQYLENIALVVQPPFTALAWYKPDSNVFATTFAMGDASGSNYFQIGWTGTSARCRVAAAGSSSTATSGTSDATLDVWKLIGGSVVTDTYRKSWLNNGSAGTSAVSRSPAVMDRTTVGRTTGQASTYASGVIDMVGVWRGDLLDAEVKYLYNSQSDFRAVRPDDLVELWILRGDGNVTGEIRGFPLYNFGPVQSTTAPIVPYQPRRRLSVKAPAAGGNVTASPSVLSAVASLPAPNLTSQLTVTALSAVASLPAPALLTSLSTAPLSAVATLPAPALEARISPSALSALVSLQAPTLVIDGANVTFNAPALSAVASLPTPTVIVPANVTFNASALSAVTTLPTPAVTGPAVVVVVPPGSGGSAGGDGGFAYAQAAGAARTPGTASERKPYLETIKELSREAEAEAAPEEPKARRSRAQRRREKIAREKAGIRPQIQATGKPSEPLPPTFAPYPIPPASPSDIQARAEAGARQEEAARVALRHIVDAENQRQSALAELQRVLHDQQLQDQARQAAIAAHLQAIAEDDAEFQLITQLLTH